MRVCRENVTGFEICWCQMFRTQTRLDTRAKGLSFVFRDTWYAIPVGPTVSCVNSQYNRRVYSRSLVAVHL